MHSRPLFSGAKLGLAVRLDDATTHDAEAWLDLTLTEQPPDLKLSRLRYLLWGDPATHVLHPRRDELRNRVRPLPLRSAPGAWTRHEIDPARDADATALDGRPLGGRDNAMTGVRLTLRVRRAGRLLLHVDDLTIAHEVAGNALRARQRELAGALAARHGVVCHIAQEISRAGPHKNAWGSGVPLLDYASARGGFTHEQGVAWARQHGGVFSLNHPFSKYNRVDLDDPQREQILEELIRPTSTAAPPAPTRSRWASPPAATTSRSITTCGCGMGCRAPGSSSPAVGRRTPTRRAWGGRTGTTSRRTSAPTPPTRRRC